MIAAAAQRPLDPTPTSDACKPGFARPVLECLAKASANSPHRIHVVCDPALKLAVAQLDPIGLIVTEAISNACKHAFPTGRTGDIWVRLGERDGRITLAVRDNGLGMGDRPGDGHSGHCMIETVARQLGGYARFGSANFGGAEVLAVFPRGT